MQGICQILVIMISLMANLCEGLIELRRENKLKVLNECEKRAVVLFHQEWCSDSRNVQRIMNQFEQQYNNEKCVTFAEVRVIDEYPFEKDELKVKGFPSIYFYKEGVWNQYEYDIGSRRVFRYFIDLHFFGKVMNVESVQEFDKNKMKYIMLFIHTKGSFEENVSPTFAALAKDNPLYTFIESDDKYILNRFFIEETDKSRDKIKREPKDGDDDDEFRVLLQQSVKEKGVDEECGYFILVRRNDRFDRYLRICSDSSLSSERVSDFFRQNEKPYRMYSFSQRARKYLIKSEHLAISLLYRKRVYQDQHIYNSFYNVTRDIRNIIDQKKDDYYNYMSSIKDKINSQVIFFFLDRQENSLTRRLAEHFDEDNYENTPSVVLFRFNNEMRVLEKYKFKLKRTDFMVYSDLILFLQNILNPIAAKTIQYNKHKPIESQQNLNMYQLTTYQFERIFSPKYREVMHKERVYMVIFFFSQFSIDSLRILPLLQQIQKSIKIQNAIEITFTLFDVSENDQQPFAFQPKVQIVPEIRIYSDNQTYQQLELQPVFQQDEQIIISTLANYINHFIQTSVNVNPHVQSDL